MRQPPFKPLSVRQEQIGLSDAEVDKLLGFSMESLQQGLNAGSRYPTRVETNLIMELSIIIACLAQVLKPDAARSWLFAPNKSMVAKSPADLIAANDLEPVHSAIEAMEDGVFF